MMFDLTAIVGIGAKMFYRASVADVRRSSIPSAVHSRSLRVSMPLPISVAKPAPANSVDKLNKLSATLLTSAPLAAASCR